MALDSWLQKVKKAISNGIESVRPLEVKKVGVLAFEVAGLMSKLVQLWQSVSEKSVAWIRLEAIAVDGVRKIVSNDDALLLGLACAELAESLRVAAASVGRIGRRCDHPGLREFDRLFTEFADSDRDSSGWVMSKKEMDGAARRMGRLASATAVLHKAVDELLETESRLKKLVSNREEADSVTQMKKLYELNSKLMLLKQEVKRLQGQSPWNKKFDVVGLLMARSTFTILARIKYVFGLGHDRPAPLPRSLSATIFPSDNSAAPSPTGSFASATLLSSDANSDGQRFFDANAKLLKPPATTLGAAALAVHYANLVIVLEKMIRSPHLVGLDARDDLYSMLPASLRGALRARLRGVAAAAANAGLAEEWKDALGRILEWLSPLAHNTIRWHSERSFEQQGSSAARSLSAGNVLMLQTLIFANQEKAEAAITELLVGLNYVWRFEREMSARALLDCSSKLHGYLKLHDGAL